MPKVRKLTASLYGATAESNSTAGSIDGKSLIVRIAEAGEIIGPPGTISGTPYELAAEGLDPAPGDFIGREPFLRFIREHGDATLRLAQNLIDIYHATCREVRYLGSSTCGGETGSLSSGLELQSRRGFRQCSLCSNSTHEETRRC
jgi:hypothetical protein